VRASGRGPLRHLTPSRNVKRDFTPSWAPDGHRLVFVRTRRHPCREQIRVYRAGRSCAIFSRSCGYELGGPVWSVRGQIAFSWRDAIYTMRPDGSHRRRVVAGYAPDWSPHGHWIVFTRHPPGGGSIGDIAMIRPNGRGLRVLTGGEGDFGGPVFSPDGRYIVHAFRPPPPMIASAQAGSQAGLVVMRLRDRSKRMIVTNPPGFPATYDWQALPRRRHP
jgi:Tol biopolymer transport system component